MATALTPSDKALNATEEKANFQRLSRLLVCGGITLLREVFDSIHPPAVLPIKLADPTIKAKLQKLTHKKVLTQAEWNQLYPFPGVNGKSTDFDITLLFKLLRNLCGLTPPRTGWNDLPNITDLFLEADLVRIKYYRNEVWGHTTTMEISNPKFVDLWRDISEALLRIASSISNVRKVEWQNSIDAFLRDPLTPDAERYIAELDSWYKNDMVVKDELITLRKEMEKMNIEQQQRFNILIHIITATIKPCTCGSSGSVIPGHFPNFLTISPQLQEAQLPPGSVCVPISSQESQTEGAVAGQPTHTELQAIRQTPSSVFDFWHVVFSVKKSVNALIEHLRKVLGLDVVDSRLGSLSITVACSSLEVLERLWEDYCSGHLSEVVQEKLVTPEVLRELNVSEVTLKTIIMEDEYEKLKQFLKNRSGNLAEPNVSEAPPESITGEHEYQHFKRLHFPKRQGNLLELGFSEVTPESNIREDRDVGFDWPFLTERTVPLLDRCISRDSGSGDDMEYPSDLISLRPVSPLFLLADDILKDCEQSIYLVPSMLMDSLPLSLRNDLVKILDSPSPSPNWRILAKELGFRMGDIQWLEQLPPGSSPADTLLRMMEAQNYPMSALASTLRKLGLDDAASITEEHHRSERETLATYKDP